MIALWLLYALTIAFALGSAAALLERALRWSAKPARFVWAAALLASCALPLWSALRPPASIAFSLAVVGALALAQRTVLRDRASWRDYQVDGTAVLVSPQLGPGVWVLSRGAHRHISIC